MASTAITTTSAAFIPSNENHFGDQIQTGIISPSYCGKDPYASSTIRPYVPSDNTGIINECQLAFNKHKFNPLTFDSSGAVFITQRDALTRALVRLSPKDLANFSEVSKCCYLATKIDVLWIIKFQEEFPNTVMVSIEKCSFSPEQQFKIYFKRMNDELKPYKAQLASNNGILKKLTGPHGNDGTLAQAEKEYNALGGEEALTKCVEQLRIAYQNNNEKEENTIQSFNEELLNAKQTHDALKQFLTQLVGSGYDGTIASIDPNSQLFLCQDAIAKLSNSFNNQRQFEQFIQASEVAKNNVSEHHGEVIPQDIFHGH